MTLSRMAPSHARLFTFDSSVPAKVIGILQYIIYFGGQPEDSSGGAEGAVEREHGAGGEKRIGDDVLDFSKCCLYALLSRLNCLFSCLVLLSLPFFLLVAPSSLFRPPHLPPKCVFYIVLEVVVMFF